VAVAVSDTGLGIGADHLPHLFERFYSVDQSRTRDVGGTGLGLSIVKEIADFHKGSINVESEVGKGSTFTLVLPAMKS
jgi:two-component system phosphate regulon sensor histidine kinase PhoR